MTEQRMTYQARAGVRRTMIWDDERPGQVTVHTEQVVDEILAGVARDRELLNVTGPNRHIARLPVEVFERMIREGWGPDDEARWLNSAEAAPFRIWPGKV